MSMCYWGIDGFGTCLNPFYLSINSGKVKKKLKEILEKDQLKNLDNQNNIFDADWFHGDPYRNFAEFLCEAYDYKNILSWEDDGDKRCFILYHPPYPWGIRPEDPKSMDELASYIAEVLKNVIDLSGDEIKKKLEYVSDWGCA